MQSTQKQNLVTLIKLQVASSERVSSKSKKRTKGGLQIQSHTQSTDLKLIFPNLNQSKISIGKKNGLGFGQRQWQWSENDFPSWHSHKPNNPEISPSFSNHQQPISSNTPKTHFLDLKTQFENPTYKPIYITLHKTQQAEKDNYNFQQWTKEIEKSNLKNHEQHWARALYRSQIELK